MRSCFRSILLILLSLVPVLALQYSQAQEKSASAPVDGIVTASDAAAPAPTPSNRLAQQTVRVAEHLEPAIPRPAQEKAAAEKLAAFEKRTGRKPNIVLLLVDDMGWGDCGCFGGGVALGGATPNIDALAASGLKLTSCYAQLTCTPTRSTLLTRRLPIRTGLTRPTLANEKFLVKGEGEKSPRQQFLYWTDGGKVAALRWGDMKLTFLRQNSKGLKVWETAFEELRMPMLTNLRMDPFERAFDEASEHPQYAGNRLFYFTPAVEYVAQWISSFRDFPPRAKPGTYGLGNMVEAMTAPHGPKK